MADTVLELMQEAVARYDRKPFLLIRPGFRTRITRYRDLGPDRAARRPRPP